MPTVQQAQAWYNSTDPVHDFEHVLRVYRSAQRLALEEGADMEIVLAAALLHDAEGAASGGEGRADHHHQSADFAAQVLADEGWPQERIRAVRHCIRAHRYRDTSEPPATLEAKILFDADKLDVLGAVGVARVIAYAVLAGQPVYAQPSQKFLDSGQEEPGEPHSAYHEYLFKLRRVKARMFTATARRIAGERDAYIGEYFRRLGAEYRGEA
jgi:uncharacterized protein